MEPEGEDKVLGQRRLENMGASFQDQPMDNATRHLLRTLVKTTLRLDEDVSRLRADCNFMLFVDSVTETNTLQSLREAAQKWQEAFVEKKVTTSLRVILFCGLVKRLREAVEQVQTDAELKDRLLRVGWLEDGINALLPAWHLGRHHAATGGLGKATPNPGPTPEVPGCFGEGLQPPHSPPEVPLDAQAGSGDAGRCGAVHAFHQPSDVGVPRMPRSFVNPGIQRRLEDAWASAAPRKSAAVPDGQGADRGLSDGPLYGLDPTAGPVDTAAAAAYEVGPRAHCLPVRLRTSLFASPSHLLPAKLQNPHTVCYFNASAQAFAWLGHLTADLQACCGRLQAAARTLGKVGRTYLPGCLPCSPVLRSWPTLRTQNDVGEFMQHLLQCAAPRAYHGAWQSRTSNPLTVEDGGPLNAPILLDMRGDTMQDLIDAWSSQPAVHALETHSGLVLLQLKRYSSPGGVPTKNSAPVHVKPGEALAIPVFAVPDSLELLYRQFSSCFCHIPSWGFTAWGSLSSSSEHA